MDHLGKVVGVEGFEPPTSCSQSRRATRLRYTPLERALNGNFKNGKELAHIFVAILVRHIIERGMSVDSPGHADFPAPAFSLANGPIVYAVAWIHHNANEAWGADDRLHGISVHASTAHASSHAHRHFKTAFGDKDPMLADGNNFYYPTGANCGFEVFKIQIPQKFYEDLARRSNSNMDTQLHDGYVESDPDDALWRTVFNACLTPLETTRVTVLALLPKPITDMPWRHYPPEGAAQIGRAHV